MPSPLADKIRAKFPGAYDDMDDAALEKSVLAKHPEYQDLATPTKPAAPSAPDSFIRSTLKTLGHGALDALPGIGAVVGGVLSTPETGGMGTIPGIALGAGAGRGVRDLIAAGLGMEKPATMGTEAARIGGETALTGATAAAMPGVVAAAKAPIQTLREGAEHFADAMPPVVRRLGKLFPSLPQSAAPTLERPPWQSWSEPPAAPPTPNGTGTSFSPGAPVSKVSWPTSVAAPAESAAPTAAKAAPAALSDLELAQREVAAGRLPQSALAAIERAQAAPPKPPPGMMRGTLRPITVSPESPMQPPGVTATEGVKPPPTTLDPQAQAIRDQTASPLQQPRRAVGAEVVGRQNGQTIQQVRDATGPIRGEAPGTAAGMPTNPKDRIVQKLIDMGPKGQGLPEADREAYAAAGTSDKTRIQVQAYLDALRKVGFAAPLAVPSVRDLIMQKLGQGHDQ